MTTAAIALGSNLGDRAGHLAFAFDELDALLSPMRRSSLFETAPVLSPSSGSQPDFLNAAAVGDTTLTASELLERLLAIEQRRGRTRPFPDAPRTLDLDLILFGTVILDSPHLVIPHPRFRERRFVLEPLAQIAPKMLDPASGHTIRELLNRLQR
jgi:2-amino-4-hydroxy-6-hydroxymethyldihydropteridine diphosphokinase